MLDFPHLKTVHMIKRVLLGGMIAVALFCLYQALQITADNQEKLEHWPRQTALFIGQFDEEQIEIEVPTAFSDSLPSPKTPEYCFPHDINHSCLLLPRNPFAWSSVLDEVELLQNPQHPAQLEVLNLTGLWSPVFAYTLVMLLVAISGKYFATSNWGEDKTWWNGQWRPSESSPQHVGFGSLEAEVIREPDVNIKGIVFWSLMCLGIVAIAVPGLTLTESGKNIEAFIILALVLFVVGSVSVSAIRTYSRKIYQDQTGLIDANFFGVKRLPWEAVGNIELVNLNQEAQTRYLSRFEITRRPADLNVFIISDKQQQRILHLSQHMLPADAFERLLQRLHDKANKGQTVTKPSSTDLRAELNDMLSRMALKPRSLLHRENRGLLITLGLMLLPFLIATSYFCYQSLWFAYGAERATGQIIEVKNDNVPSLLIEYRTKTSQTFHIESDGSASYAKFKVGDHLTVFYDPAAPQNARIDLFLELWLSPLIMGSISVIILILTILITRAMTAPLPGM